MANSSENSSAFFHSLEQSTLSFFIVKLQSAAFLLSNSLPQHPEYTQHTNTPTLWQIRLKILAPFFTLSLFGHNFCGV